MMKNIYVQLNLYIMNNTVNFKLFRKSESVQFFNDLVTLCSESNPKALNIQAQLVALNECINSLNMNFVTDRSSEITSDLISLDQRRDKAITCLRMLTEGFTNHFDPDKRSTAILLLKTIDKYGSSISRMNYQAETSTLDNLGDELLNDASSVNQVNQLGLTDIVNEMIEANNAFNIRYLDRVREEAGQNEVAAGELIKKCIAGYRLLTAHIEAHSTLNPCDELSTLIERINELIERYNLTVQRKNMDDEAA
jgi:hypothetical protein